MNNMLIGVVAEFNPFHNGHLYQLKKIKEKEPVITIALISGDYVQRGEISFLTKEEKTKIALEMGYDIVVELPCYYSIQNADIFSLFSVKILELLKVDFQVFGIEEENLSNIEKILQIQKEEKYKKALLKYQKEGLGYIKAHSMALKEYDLESVYKSNNILALSYIKWIKEEKLNLKYYPIKRKGVDYNEEKTSNNIASASYIRTNFNKGIKNYVPLASYNILKYKKYNKSEIENDLFKLFKYIFKRSLKNEVLNIYDFNEEIYNRINKVLFNANSYEDFLNAMKVRNISQNRIKRLILNLVLKIDKEIIEKKDICYIRILGLNEKGSKYIKSLNNEKIFVNWKDIEKKIDFKYVSIEKNSFELIKLLIKKEEKLNVIYKQ